MNVTLLLLAFMAVTAFVLFLNLRKRTKQLTDAEAKLKIANEKLAMWRHFINNTPVKKFFLFLDTVDIKAFDVEIKAMLMKYFNKVFISLNIEHVANLIADVKALKHSGVAMSALIQTNQRVGMDLIGLSLADALKKHDNERLLIINEFIELLSPESKKAQITVAIESMNSYFINKVIDLPSEYRKDAEQAIDDLKKRIE